MSALPFFLSFFPPKTRKHKALFAFLGLFLALAVALWQLAPADLPLYQLSWQGWLTLVITFVAFVINAFSSLAPEITFLGALALLFLSGILDEAQALSGFSNSGVVTVGVLYLVVTGLQQTGGLAWISQEVLGLPQGLNAALLRLMLPVLGLSAFLNNTPVVAMFIPVINDWSRKLQISPSKLMIPLSYAAIFGGMCTLIGTSTNLVVNGLLLAQTDYPSLSLFSITVISVPCAVVGITTLMLTHRWLLPERKPAISDRDDPRQYTVEMVVEPKSPISGKTVTQAGLRHLPGLFLVEIVRQGEVMAAVRPQERLRDQDQLVFVGAVESIVDLQKLRGLQPATDQVFKLNAPRTERQLIEAVVSNTCPLVGQTIREGQFRKRYNAVVLAVARNGERLSGKLGDVRLQPGDTLLLESPIAFMEQHRNSRDFYLFTSIPDSEPLRHDKAPIALAILLAMVLAAALGWLTMLQAAIAATIAMVLTRCCSSDRALQSVEWTVLLVIAAALGLSEALRVTGAAQAIADSVLSLIGSDPWLALVVIYGLTNLMTEVITNNAAAALIFPIALSVSQSLGVDFMPFAIVIMIGASASFATPIGYQTNLMVYGPGGYRFTDFARVGLPLNILFCLVTVTLTPWIYPF
ncbi:MAG: SLC13 family permease [Prochlorothrix sp.]|nr:SLC13 family permease [Prochlorothrix sp.]